MRRSACSDSRGNNAWSGMSLSGYVTFFLVSISISGAMPVAQEFDSRSERVVDEACEEVLRQPLTTLDLNGDGKCDEADISLFKALVQSCQRERRSRMDRLEKLDLDCDRCITRKDVETFRAYCEEAAGKAKVSDSLTRSPNQRQIGIRDDGTELDSQR